MKRLYIFDLDGTIALIDHRRHLLEGKDPNRWRAFYAACTKDEPNFSVISVMHGLLISGSEIWIFSGRSEEVRDKTISWLHRFTLFPEHELTGPMLQMREAGDTTPDDVLKQRWLDSMLPVDRQRLVATFDDRQRVVDMWRKNGITCFQVAPGDF